MKKTFSVLLLLCMLLSLLPVSAYATGDGTQQEISGGLITIVPEEGALPDSDEILDTYAQMVMYPQYTMSLFSVGDNRLGDDRLVYIYDALETAIKKIAAGNQLSTLELKLDASSSPLAWSYDELGVTADSDDSQVTKSLFSALKLDDIHGYLMMDLPYDLYWYDKTSNGGMKAYMGYVRTEDGRAVVTTLYFNFAVSEEFREPGSVQKTNWGLENELDCYVVNAAKVNAANTAALRARSIVDAYSSYSDYDKLKAYKEEICKLTDYNRDAASSSNTQYGDPWQLIYVFDDDPNTKVVCEGYSKAFQYLCDLSSFENSDTACYTVTGVVSGNGKTEMHMWNIVSLGGKNYLVDVTNSDTGTMGDGGQLFLAGATGDISTGYTVDVGGSRVSYTYSDEQKQLMGELLVLSSEAYSDEPVEHQHQWSSDWSSDGSYHWHECIAGDCDVADNSQKDGYGEHSYGNDNVCDVCGYTKPVEHQHQWSDVWSSDGTHHWHECTAAGCGVTDNSQKDGYGEHNYGDDNVCDTCGYVKPVEHQHQWSDVWSNDGTHHWHECTAAGCGVTDNSRKDGYGEHNYGDDNTCDTCGYTKPVEHEHSWPNEWQKDENNHWKNCLETSCGAVDIHPHEWDKGTVTKEASTTEKGVKTYTCTVCGYQKTEEIPMLEHKHAWSTDWTKNSTHHWHDCTAAGCTITEASGKDGYALHTWNNGTVVKAATTTAAGIMEYTCTVCGQTKTEQIPILPTPQHDHVWSNAWTSNSTHHWHECTASGCTVTNVADKYGYAPHSFGAWRTVTAATSTKDGLMERQCVCGYKETKVIPAIGNTTEHTHNWSNWTFTSPNYWERTCSICHARDIKITEVVAPKITSGANAVWRQGSSNGLTFISDAPASQFKSVTLNGFTLSSTYYTVAEGSTIVTLKKSCLDQLGVGTHTLAIVSDGGTAQTTFTVKAKTIINNQTPTYNSTNPWSTPKTGDSSNMGLWIGMIVVCVVGIGAVAVYVVKKNKRR